LQTQLDTAPRGTQPAMRAVRPASGPRSRD